MKTVNFSKVYDAHFSHEMDFRGKRFVTPLHADVIWHVSY